MRIVGRNFRVGRAFAVLGAAAFAIACLPSLAFKPDYESHGHTMIARGVLGSGYSFGSLAAPLAVDRFRYRLSTSSVDRFPTKDAIDHIVLGVQSRDQTRLGDDDDCSGGDYVYYGLANQPNVGVVSLSASDQSAFLPKFCISKDLADGNGHFDNDNFLGSMNSMSLHVNLAIQLLRERYQLSTYHEAERHRKRVAARIMVGKALHTLQDFYAHSNWAHGADTEAIFLPLTDFLVDRASFTEAVRSLLAEPRATKEPFGQTAAGGGSRVGQGCAPRERDLFLGVSGVNSVRSWNNNDGNFELRASAPNQVTTGYWWTLTTLAQAGVDTFAAASDRIDDARCDHGVSDGLWVSSGLAKDMPGWPLDPKPNGRVTGIAGPAESDYSEAGLFTTWPVSATDSISRAAADATDLHKRASYQAARHTRVFFETVVSLVNQRAASVEEADDILAAFFGGTPIRIENAWVVDRSGTMADTLPALKTAIDSFLRGDGRYVLVDFAGGDSPTAPPDIRVTVGNDAVIRARLNAMEARGGGGCNAPVWSAIAKAVEAAYRDTVVTVMTDASASDAGLELYVTNDAQAKAIKIVKLISGSCSPLDPSYEAGSQKTGGSLALVEHDQDSVSAALVSSNATNSTPRVVHTEAAALTGSKLVTFPIETGAMLMTIVANGSLGTVTVTQPSGAPLATGAGVTASQILNGWVYAVTNPQQGNWTVNFTGNGDYSLSAYVDAPIDFDVVEQNSVVHVGRAGHEYRPSLSQSAQSGRVWLKTHIAGAQGPVVVDLLRLDGSVVSTFPLTKMTTDYFEGEVTLPTEAHRFRVRGFAADGTAFARIHGQGSVAPPVARPGRVVASMGAAGTWRAGTVNAFAINLKNLGGDDTVSFAPGTLPSGATLTCSPSSMAIPGSEQVNVLCSIFLPEAPDRADFSVVVSSTTAVPAASQTVTVPLTPLKLPLSCALDIDGDNRIDPAIDGLLLTRYLLGFRGDALTANLTIPGPRKTANLLSTFFGNAAQFDVIGRASPAPTAMVDGLIMTRLMLGYTDESLLTGINVPVGAQYTTATGIKDYVISRCAGGF